MDPEYADKEYLPRGGLDSSTLPNPRNISSTVFAGAEAQPSPAISLMVMQFGQFLDHDITLTPEPGKTQSCTTHRCFSNKCSRAGLLQFSCLCRRQESTRDPATML